MASAGFFDYAQGQAASSGENLIFLGNWSEADWERLFEYTQTHRFAPGDRVITAGATDCALYLVASGQLEVVAERRRREKVATIDEGSVVGEQAFLDGQAASFDVVAATAVESLRLSLTDFETFSARHPDLGRSFLRDLGRILSLRLRATTEQLLRRR